MSLDRLKAALGRRLPISFEYNKEGKTPGPREGNPHAVFILRRKDKSESTKVHILQTDGVSDSGQEFPSFRMFDLEEISQVQVLENRPQFEPSEEYNPEWDGYKFVIAKI